MQESVIVTCMHVCIYIYIYVYIKNDASRSRAGKNVLGYTQILAALPRIECDTEYELSTSMNEDQIRMLNHKGV